MVGSAITGLAVGVAVDPMIGIGMTLGGVSGWLITPDADHHTKTHEETRWDGVRVIGPYLQGVWAGYGSKFKHRGRSHWHGWGTLTRIWYFGRRFAADFLFASYVLVVLILDSVLDGSVVEAVIPYLPGWEFFLAWFGAWAFQDSVHIETDRVWSYFHSKRWRKHRGRIMWVVAILVITVVFSFVISRGW